MTRVVNTRGVIKLYIFLSALCNELYLINYASLKSYIGAMHVAYETTWGYVRVSGMMNHVGGM